MNLKISETHFLLIAFSNIKKAYLRESQNTPFHTNNNNFKGNNMHKKPSHTNNSYEKPLYKQFL